MLLNNYEVRLFAWSIIIKIIIYYLSEITRKHSWNHSLSAVFIDGSSSFLINSIPSQILDKSRKLKT